MSRPPRQTLLGLLCALTLVSAQLVTLVHVGEHGATGDTICVTCTIGGQLDHVAGAPPVPEIPAKIRDRMTRATVPLAPSAAGVRSHPARAPPVASLTA